MIVNNQTNIKVHFAGAESMIRSKLILKGSEINYSLFTIYPFLVDRFGIKHGYQTKGFEYKEVANHNYDHSKHTIQDSGFFSVMFGSYSGDKDEKFVQSWYQGLVDMVRDGGYLGTLVEVDAQKVIGPKKTWRLRERLKIDLPENRQINVFHIEDGQKGLDRMIEFSDYIAISVPELRATGKKNYTERLANYIKSKKPSIDIHLLGCTENKLLRSLRFCSSADSTSWVSLNKFGWFKYNNGKKTIAIKKSEIDRDELIKRKGMIVTKIMNECNKNPTDNLVYYHACDLLQLEYCKKQYSIYAGPQN